MDNKPRMHKVRKFSCRKGDSEALKLFMDAVKDLIVNYSDFAAENPDEPILFELSLKAYSENKELAATPNT